jgi:hypothetical protein
MKFTYSSGQRPLDGYTIKRGIGRGGFGEVYYGLSDGGKEVALKLVRGNLEVELRGMAQCLNFKHPNLVSLFDLRTDSQGDHWVIMEYVSGEPLSVILNRHPQGLPPELVQQWFLPLSRAVSYLHDHGIVHRDLKPANIFLENGLVKVGDYGLSKFISSSRRTAQTESVGTVHYMAPEISTGNYNKQIDVYASGIILYEMLTGRVPFEGESAGEILMKHLTSTPELGKLPAEYVPVVERALRKNPAHRFQTMGEMARVVEKVGVVEPAPRPQPSRPVLLHPVVEPARVRPVPVAVEPPAPSREPTTVRSRVAELAGSMALGAVLAGMLSILWTALGRSDDYLIAIGTCFFLTVACTWAVLVPAKLWPNREDDSWARRTCMLVLGLLVGFQALWLDGRQLSSLFPRQVSDEGPMESERLAFAGEKEPAPGLHRPAAVPRWFSTNQKQGLPVAACYLSYFGLAFFALRWWKMADRRRPQRFGFFPVLAAGFWSFGLLLLFKVLGAWPTSALPYGVVPLVMASVIVQLVSPWDQPPPTRFKRVRLRYV